METMPLREISGPWPGVHDLVVERSVPAAHRRGSVVDPRVA